jgi:DNA mismatch endonuclease (patch repair protein)
MAGIRSNNTKPELMLRKVLHSSGFRYRLHSKRLAGRPDIVLPKYRAVVFVHGCFWHQHKDCKYSVLPSTRTDFWRGKLLGNAARDARNVEELLRQGWRVAVVWECALRGPTRLDSTARQLKSWLRSGPIYLDISAGVLDAMAEQRKPEVT